MEEIAAVVVLLERLQLQTGEQSVDAPQGLEETVGMVRSAL